MEYKSSNRQSFNPLVIINQNSGSSIILSISEGRILVHFCVSVICMKRKEINNSVKSIRESARAFVFAYINHNTIKNLNYSFQFLSFLSLAQLDLPRGLELIVLIWSSSSTRKNENAPDTEKEFLHNLCFYIIRQCDFKHEQQS